MNTTSKGIICRVCGRTIESDSNTTYVTCLLCGTSATSPVIVAAPGDPPEVAPELSRPTTN